MKNNIPSTVVLDYESSPQLGWFFGSKWETNIVRTDSYETIISVSYMDMENDTVHFKAQWDFPDWKPGIWNDKSLVKFFAEELKKYDIIAGQNSDEFDIKLFNTRLAYWGFDPLPECKTLDTKKIAKNKLHLPSYSLDDMLNFFGLEGKFHHTGLDMWFGARDGNEKDQRMMKLYNNQDTRQTKKLLVKLLPFMKQFNDFTKVNPNKEYGINCSNPACLSTKLIRSKLKRVINGYRQQLQCKNCGHYTTDPKLIKYESK